MSRLIITIDGEDIKAYSDTDLEVEIFDLSELRAEYDMRPDTLAKELEKVEKELLHKTTGLKQIYP